MKIGDLIEANQGQRGLILDIEWLYPGHPSSPPRNVLIHWLDEPPRWHREGFYAHHCAIKRVVSRASR